MQAMVSQAAEAQAEAEAQAQAQAQAEAQAHVFQSVPNESMRTIMGKLVDNDIATRAAPRVCRRWRALMPAPAAASSAEQGGRGRAAA